MFGLRRKWKFGLMVSILLAVAGGITMVSISNCSKVNPEHSAKVDSIEIQRLIALDKGTIPVEAFFKNPEKTADRICA